MEVCQLSIHRQHLVFVVSMYSRLHVEAVSAVGNLSQVVQKCHAAAIVQKPEHCMCRSDSTSQLKQQKFTSTCDPTLPVLATILSISVLSHFDH